ncbi:MAG TPA: 3-phosphoshikimate 1-carboxyvinyltransferase [Acidimicrobiales bacterium]|nr:3-phosphoshikimate 1-carboxyvinyltransferase [Acidimicrobiales bacterium]
MNVFTATPSANGVRGTPLVPGDKSISHRCVLLAARAEGTSTIRGLSSGDDVARTLRAAEFFGAGVRAIVPAATGAPSVEIDGGTGRLHEPVAVVDVGNSGTCIRLIAGWASGVDGLTVLAGDESIAGRPMGRVVEPLREMGARIDGRSGGSLPPLVIRGGSLHGIDYRLPVPSAQVKGALLLAGISAEGATTVREEVGTRTHTEELLALAGADLDVTPGAVTVRRSKLTPFEVTVPADPSQAAFWVVAACVTPGSDVTLPNVYVGPARAGFLDVLRRMGADIELAEEDPTASTATIRARHSALRATEVGGDEVPALIDEIPVLAVAAAYAEGTTTFSGAAELRVKETDRVETMVAALRAIGANVEPLPDGLVVDGRGGNPLDGGRVQSAGDHRVAMSLAVAALASKDPVIVDGWNAVATSYPGFEDEYQRCT